MESKNNSCEKLVDVEAGLISSKKLTNFPFVKILHRDESPKRCTNLVLILLATLLLAIISWQIYQTVHNERFMKSIESQDSGSEILELPLIQEDTRIQEMTEQLNRLQHVLKEMEKKIDQLEQPSTTTELPAVNFDKSVLDSELVLFKILSEQENSDDVESSTSDTTIPPYFPEFPEFPIFEKNISQNLDESDSLSPIIVSDPIDETESEPQWWSFSFRFGGKSEEDASSKESNFTESKESEVAASTETEESSPYSTGFLFGPFESTWKIDWGSSDIGDSKDSESEEQIEEDPASEEMETIETTEEPTYADYSPYSFTENYYDIDQSDYDYADFYENSVDNKNDDIEVSTYGTTENSLGDTSTTEDPTTESSLTSTVSQDVEKIFESETTEGRVTSSPTIKIYEFSSNDDNSEQSTDFYALGSVADNLAQILGVGPTPNAEESEDGLSSSIKNLEELLMQHDHELIEKYFRDLIAKRISQVVSLDEQYSNLEGDEYIDMLRGDDFESFWPMPSTSTSDEWPSYISKRSVDTPSVLERRTSESSTPAELERKMVILRQSINDDNDFLQEEVSLTPEPMKHVLQEKLNSFYAKMEAVSAHIDRLHERFLRLNKLDDDYISREFSSEDDEASSTSNN